MVPCTLIPFETGYPFEIVLANGKGFLKPLVYYHITELINFQELFLFYGKNTRILVDMTHNKEILFKKCATSQNFNSYCFILRNFHSVQELLCISTLYLFPYLILISFPCL